MASFELIPKQETHQEMLKQIDIEDIEEAYEFLEEQIEQGNFPIVSVPVEYAVAAEKGIEPHTSWVEQARIRARVGKPYVPEGQIRVCFRVKKSVESFRPERTGPDKHFHGVVTVLGPIAGNELEETPCSVEPIN